jgi:L-fucose mutarotase
MLRGIHPALSPELLATLHRMGHGDELILADAHFPGENLGAPVLRADGVDIDTLLDGILPLIMLDTYVEAPLVMMDAVTGDVLDPAVAARYRAVVDRHQPQTPTIALLERFSFYERARRAFCVVMTGDAAKYGNLLLKKGVTPPMA